MNQHNEAAMTPAPTSSSDVLFGHSTDGRGQLSFFQGRQLVWFSCGAASAVAAYLAVKTHKGPEPIEVLYCEMANEHEDNIRFRADVEQWIGAPVIGLRSKEYPSMDIFDVFEKERYIAGIGGATCTKHLKREVRMQYERPEDIHIFGYTADEGRRIAQFERENPYLKTMWILRDLGITKEDCHRIIADAGIESPAMYGLGLDNNNCRCCVKGGAAYQAKCRKLFPADWHRLAALSRALGVRLISYKGERIYLDELPLDADDSAPEPSIECGPQCIQPQYFEQ